jgi:hypothetical protein
MMEFKEVSIDSARASLDELPSGVDVVVSRIPGYWERMRRAPLATDRALTGRAMTWLAELPEDVRPKATMERYPRIINALTGAWGDAHAREKYFEHLLNDRRSGRRGFPLDVERELSVLCLYASSLPA